MPDFLPSSPDADPGVEILRLREKLALLEKRLLAVQAEDARVIDELKGAVRARDEFIAIAAHELRSPMSTIMLSVYNLRLSGMRAQPPSPEPFLRKLESLERRIEHYLRRTTMLLDASRLTSGNFSLELEPVDLSELTRRVLNEFAEQFEQAGCRLNASIDEHISGYWDPMGLELILVNLISNAAKYGSGKPIDVELRGEDDSAVLTVRDRGVGISEEDQARMFLKFERAFKRSEYGGFGIGLWITGQIIDMLQGKITVQSSSGAGSTFVVTLPRNSQSIRSNDAP